MFDWNKWSKLTQEAKKQKRASLKFWLAVASQIAIALPMCLFLTYSLIVLIEMIAGR